MKIEHYYRVEVIAFGLIAFLAAAGVWMTLTAPQPSFMTAALDIIWFLVTLFWFVSTVRRKLGIISEPRIRPWMVLALSLLVFFSLFLAIGEFDTYGLAKILSFIMYLVLAMFLFFAAIVKYYHLVQEPD